MTLKLVVDEGENDCPAVGIDPKGHDGIPCNLLKGHKGKHEFPLPFSFEVWGWTDKNRKMKRI